ncbi:hypothetical protein [Thalassoglobus sp.]|uniref:hypothetical protein n=1 Tax=Thalassoglobus sp. TaxID=2795869 RepID=UPI003AA89E31
MNIWQQRCEIILNQLSPTPSQARFVSSVLSFILRTGCPPTRQQQAVLSNIWKHCIRVYAEEKQMELVEAEELV